MKSLLLLLIFIMPLAVSARDKNLCLELCKKHGKTHKRMAKILRLLKKNNKHYEKYKDNISLKIKLSSNILILSTKKEETQIVIDDIKKQYDKAGCLECRKVNGS